MLFTGTASPALIAPANFSMLTFSVFTAHPMAPISSSHRRCRPICRPFLNGLDAVSGAALMQVETADA